MTPLSSRWTAEGLLVVPDGSTRSARLLHLLQIALVCRDLGDTANRDLALDGFVAVLREPPERRGA